MCRPSSSLHWRSSRKRACQAHFRSVEDDTSRLSKARSKEFLSWCCSSLEMHDSRWLWRASWALDGKKVVEALISRGLSVSACSSDQSSAKLWRLRYFEWVNANRVSDVNVMFLASRTTWIANSAFPCSLLKTSKSKCTIVSLDTESAGNWKATGYQHLWRTVSLREIWGKYVSANRPWSLSNIGGRFFHQPVDHRNKHRSRTRSSSQSPLRSLRRTIQR